MTDKLNKPLSDTEKQIQPLRGEVSLDDLNTKVFLAAQKASARFTIDKIKR